jgi:hypothetical protein
MWNPPPPNIMYRKQESPPMISICMQRNILHLQLLTNSSHETWVNDSKFKCDLFLSFTHTHDFTHWCLLPICIVSWKSEWTYIPMQRKSPRIRIDNIANTIIWIGTYKETMNGLPFSTHHNGSRKLIPEATSICNARKKKQ